MLKGIIDKDYDNFLLPCLLFPIYLFSPLEAVVAVPLLIIYLYLTIIYLNNTSFISVILKSLAVVSVLIFWNEELLPIHYVYFFYSIVELICTSIKIYNHQKAAIMLNILLKRLLIAASFIILIAIIHGFIEEKKTPFDFLILVWVVFIGGIVPDAYRKERREVSEAQ